MIIARANYFLANFPLWFLAMAISLGTLFTIPLLGAPMLLLIIVVLTRKFREKRWPFCPMPDTEGVFGHIALFIGNICFYGTMLASMADPIKQLYSFYTFPVLVVCYVVGFSKFKKPVSTNNQSH